MRVLLLLTIAAWPLGFRIASAAELSTETVTRLRTEAPVAWELCRQRLHGHEVTARSVCRVVPLRADGSADTTREIKLSGTTKIVFLDAARLMAAVVDDKESKPHPVERHRAILNERYSFNVSRSQPADSFLLKGVTAGAALPRDIEGELRNVRPGLHVDGFPLPDYLTRPNFVIKECHPGVTSDGTPLVVVEFEFTPTGEMNVDPGRHILELMPDRDWQLHRAVITGGAGQSSYENIVTIDYELMTGGQWIPRRRTYIQLGNDKPGERWRDSLEVEVSVPVPTKVKLEEFYLPHYGISESIVDVPAWGRGARMLLFAAGAGLLIAGVVLFRRMDRKRQAA